MDDNFRSLANAHFAELKEKYPDLILSFLDDSAVVAGVLQFQATYNGVFIADAYKIEIELSLYYPLAPPFAKEIGGKIPEDFHKLNNGALCLGAPIEVAKKFNSSKNLIGFVEDLLIPYLYSYSHKVKYNYLPFGELAHGDRGLLDNYIEKFEVSTDLEALKILKFLAEGKYKGHLDCPCGSKKRLRTCHGKTILELAASYPKEYFLTYYFYFILFLFPGLKDIPKELHSLKLLADLKKLS